MRFSPESLKRHRLESGIRVEHLAVSIGRGVDSIRKYESGTATPPSNIAAAIATTLGVQIGDLFTDDEAVA